jgi:hypothetical protein
MQTVFGSQTRSLATARKRPISGADALAVALKYSVEIGAATEHAKPQNRYSRGQMRSGEPWDGVGDPWWVLAEVCRTVGIGNPSDVAGRLGSNEKATLDRIEGGNPGSRYTIINEAGLYEVLRKSDKPAAKRWGSRTRVTCLHDWMRTKSMPSVSPTPSVVSSKRQSSPALV